VAKSYVARKAADLKPRCPLRACSVTYQGSRNRVSSGFLHFMRLQCVETASHWENAEQGFGCVLSVTF
jgi:hypothetical protein